jgi:tetratricopeptide (TPR) repeat protein
LELEAEYERRRRGTSGKNTDPQVEHGTGTTIGGAGTVSASGPIVMTPYLQALRRSLEDQIRDAVRDAPGWYERFPEDAAEKDDDWTNLNRALWACQREMAWRDVEPLLTDDLRSRVLLKIKKLAAAARRCPQDDLEDRPGSFGLEAFVLVLAGAVYWEEQAGDLQRAMACYRLEARAGNSVAHLRLGDLMAGLGDEMRAVEHYQAALRSRCPGAALRMGELFLRNDSWAEANRVYQQALASKLDLPDAAVALGWLNEEAGRYRDAERCYQAALNADVGTLAGSFRRMTLLCAELAQVDVADRWARLAVQAEHVQTSPSTGTEPAQLAAGLLTLTLGSHPRAELALSP